MDNDIVYKMALTQIPLVGAKTAKNLIGYCGGVKEIYNKSVALLKKVPGVGEQIAQNIYSFKDFDRVLTEIEFMENNGIKSYFFLDDTYPFRLRQIPDGPIMLYSRGQANLNPSKTIAIVGTRKMTNYGQQFINRFLEELSPYKPTIVSGLAYGVDIWAHKQSLKVGLPTWGVVAHGLDRIYPSVHTSIAKEMVANQGAIISEYFANTVPNREHFPMRNRLVAGMVDAVIVVESAIKGGSLITAELANQYNRDVLALPGAITSRYSVGCNSLIKKNKAHLLDGIESLVELLNWDVKVKKPVQHTLFEDLSEVEKKVWTIIQNSGGIGIDELVHKSGFESSLLAITLLELEMKNCILSLPGKRYKSIA